MKKSLKTALCLVASFSIAASALAADVTLYALDGRTIEVDEAQVGAYTEIGMGWYIEKPVEMYALDGRTITVAAHEVEAYKNVGWYLKEESDTPQINTPDINGGDKKEETPKTEENSERTGKAVVQYLDGTTVTVPARDVKKYEELGWIEIDEAMIEETVIMYNADGAEKAVKLSEVDRYELAGWTKTKPNVNYMTVYSHDGSTKEIPQDQYEAYKSQGWFSAFDEAVYDYAAFGNHNDIDGAVKLLEKKKYEQAYNMVADALEVIKPETSDYIAMLHQLRSLVTDTWREAAKSPLGFINFWFSEKDGKDLIVFEYRNVSNSRIQSFKINFDITDKDGNVVETNSKSYNVSKLQMIPCDSKRVAWEVKNGDVAAGIKNLRVLEVVFSDGTKWSPSV